MVRRQSYSFSIRDPAIYLYLLPPIPGFSPNAGLNMLILFIPLLVWAVLSSVETYCESAVTVPPLASCDRALTIIEKFVRRAGNYERTFGPSESKGTITLPIWFADVMYDGEGGSCSIMLQWKPRSGFPSPPSAPYNSDHFWAVEVQRAAVRIRDTCVQVGKMGEEWIEPRQWVQVAFYTSWSASYPSNATGIDRGLSIGTANGTNVTISVSMVNEGNLVATVPD